MNSYGTAYDKTEGSTYFSFIEMGQLFEKADFSSTDGSIENTLDPLDGWRLPTQEEWAKVVTTDASVRPGSTVIGSANKHYALITLTGVTHAGSATPNGLLIFPDGKDITGKALSDMDIETQTSGVTLEELNEYLEQGCAFLPASGYYYDNYCDGGYSGNYWSSSRYVNEDYAYSEFFDDTTLNTYDFVEINLVFDLCVRLVRE